MSLSIGLSVGIDRSFGSGVVTLSPGTIAFDSANGWTTGENPPQIAVTLPSDGSIQVGDWFCMFYGTSPTLSGATQAPWHQITSNDVLNGTVGLSYNWGVSRLPSGLTYFGSEFGRGATAGTITLTSAMSNIISDALAAPVATLTTGTGSAGAGTDRSQFVNATSLQYILNTAAGQVCCDRTVQSANNAKFQVEIAVNGFQNSVYTGFDDGTTNLNSVIPLPGGASGSNGFFVRLTNVPSANQYSINGTDSNALNSISTINTSTIFTFAVDTTANTIKLLQNGTLIQTFTLTSKIPSTWRFFAGGYTGTGTVATSDASTINYGATAFAYPQTGYSPYVS